MEQYVQTKDSGVSWIQGIPSDWGIRVLFQLADQVKNKNKDLAETNLLSLSYGKIKRKDINNPEGLLPESFDGYNIIETDDIVLRLTDLQNDHTSLRVGQAKERGIITSAYTTLRPSNLINPQYLDYVLHAYDLIKGFYGMGAGVRQGLNFDEVKMIKVPYPPLAEQEKISIFLNKQVTEIDSIIEETKHSIENYRAWRASIIAETVLGKRNTEEKKKSGVEWIDELPKGWEIARLKTLFSFGKGLPITKDNLTEEGIPVISYGQIHAKFNNGTGIVEKLLRYVPDSFLQSNPESLVNKGDFLVADTSEDIGGCGNAVYIDRNMTLFAGYHTIILKSLVGENNKYLAYLFKTDAWRSQIRTKVSGVKLFSISKKILSMNTVILPPPEEQSQIVDALDQKCKEIDSIIVEKETLMSELEQYKRALIYDTVTGKRKVV